MPKIMPKVEGCCFEPPPTRNVQMAWVMPFERLSSIIGHVSRVKTSPPMITYSGAQSNALVLGKMGVSGRSVLLSSRRSPARSTEKAVGCHTRDASVGKLRFGGVKADQG